MLRVLILFICLGSNFSKAAFMSDPYEVLGVSTGVSDEELRKARKKALVAVHPDKARLILRERGLNESSLQSILIELDEKAKLVNSAYSFIVKVRSNKPSEQDVFNEQSSWKAVAPSLKVRWNVSMGKSFSQNMVELLARSPLTSPDELAKVGLRFLLDSYPLNSMHSKFGFPRGTLDEIYTLHAEVSQYNGDRPEVMQAAFQAGFLYLEAILAKHEQFDDRYEEAHRRATHALEMMLLRSSGNPENPWRKATEVALKFGYGAREAHPDVERDWLPEKNTSAPASSNCLVPIRKSAGPDLLPVKAKTHKRKS